MMMSELRELPAGFCCCIFIFESINNFVAGEPPVEVHKYTGQPKGGLNKSFFHQKQAEKLPISDFLVNLCTYMNRVRVKPLFFESGFCWGVNFISGSSPKSPKKVNFEKRSSLEKQGSVSSEQEERGFFAALRMTHREEKMLTEGFMHYEDEKSNPIAVRIANAIKKYEEKTPEKPEFVEINPENWVDALEGAVICGLPVRCERSVPKNTIYVGRRLNREGHK